ncbi:diguanylate cyclase domain-containing protein [Acinetobacter calcoaceticus]|uniref:diguanylate cyclase domain-containing protein n=1 Tax=Acinetobacter calcoaceticus TaxID=471 RepID=UPI00227284FC|nr:diguanylate cyclase [Acinetobacter calcoaceticus]GLG83341.1 GGDEF domain-containing protein [Acinetobacter calcoaceticus]
MPKYLACYRWALLFLGAACGLSLWLFVQLGNIKSFSEWNWVDILGEGGATVFIGIWIFFLIKSRPLGRVTNYIFYGLCFTFFHMWMDSLDEFIRLPKDIAWDAWLESIPFPIGLYLLTMGIYFWHQEELAISKHMQKRERIYRDHRLFDALTPLADAHYFKTQLKSAMEQEPEEMENMSVVLLDMHNFNQVNQMYSFDEGTSVLQHISQLISLNLRPNDLLCRFAGDRFIILLPKTNVQQAKKIALQLERMIMISAYYHRDLSVQIPLKALTAYCSVGQYETTQQLLSALNQQLVQLKQQSSTKRVTV